MLVQNLIKQQIINTLWLYSQSQILDETKYTALPSCTMIPVLKRVIRRHRELEVLC